MPTAMPAESAVIAVSVLIWMSIAAGSQAAQIKGATCNTADAGSHTNKNLSLKFGCASLPIARAPNGLESHRHAA